MEEKRLQQCGFISLNCEEMQVRDNIKSLLKKKVENYAILGGNIPSSWGEFSNYDTKL